MNFLGQTSSNIWVPSTPFTLILHDALTRLCSPEFPSKALSSNSYSAHNLVRLILPNCTNYNAVEQLQNGLFFQHFVNLKMMDLSDSSLSRLPETSAAQKLEILKLPGCVNLIDVLSIHRLYKLQHVNMRGCICVKRLPSLCNLKLLKTLDLSNCSRLDKLPPSIGHLGDLVSLDLTNCTKLEQLPGCIFRLTSLETLSIAGCSTLMRRFTVVERPAISRGSITLFGNNTCGTESEISSQQTSKIDTIFEESRTHLEKKNQSSYQPIPPYLESQAMELDATKNASEPYYHLPCPRAINISTFIHNETKKQLGVAKLRNSSKIRKVSWKDPLLFRASPEDFKEAMLALTGSKKALRFCPSEPTFLLTLVEKKKKALGDYLSMSLEDIHQQPGGFLKLETIAHSLLMKHRSSIFQDEQTALKGLKHSLAELRLSFPETVMSVENAEAQRAVLVEKSREVDARLIEGKLELASVEAEFSRLSEEEEFMDAQIECLIAKKMQISILG